MPCARTLSHCGSNGRSPARVFCVFLTQALVACALLGATPAAYAQTGGKSGRAAAYWADVLRVAEILGSVHYMRDLCDGSEGQVWREKMRELLKATEPDEQTRELLVGHFNSAYHKARIAHGRCSGKTVTEINRLLDEGAKLSARLSAIARP